jgi:arginine decarboxylase
MKNIVIGNRVPKEFFIVSGQGESDITIHAGSYHLALKDAGIEMGNIMTYSSILPKIAQEIPYPENITHGEVIESIMSVANTESSEICTAGIIYGRLYNKTTGEKYGGLVCEHAGNYSNIALKEKLNASIQELYTNGFDTTYDLKDIRVIQKSFQPEKKYGTVLVSLCFVSYEVPIL